MKQLFLIAGANGSGKSTVSKVLLPKEDIVYVNPDDIAHDLNPLDVTKARVSAGRMALSKVANLIDCGESFAIESTLSGRTYLNLIKRARSLGYVVTIAYVFVDSPIACINRIAIRVKMGGHFVPDEDVRRRYVRSKRNFESLYKSLVDHWLLYYNGGTDLQLVAHGNGDASILDPIRYAQFKEGSCQK